HERADASVARADDRRRDAGAGGVLVHDCRRRLTRSRGPDRFVAVHRRAHFDRAQSLGAGPSREREHDTRRLRRLGRGNFRYRDFLLAVGLLRAFRRPRRRADTGQTAPPIARRAGWWVFGDIWRVRRAESHAPRGYSTDSLLPRRDRARPAYE